MNKFKYFELSEFNSKDAPGSGVYMRASTLLKADATRENYGQPLVISSGYRTPERNKAVGGVKNSSHLLGFAIDWKAISDDNLIKFLDAAWEAGFRRFGIMATAIHTDDDPTKTSPALWTYKTTPNSRFQVAKIWFNRKINEG